MSAPRATSELTTWEEVVLASARQIARKGGAEGGARGASTSAALAEHASPPASAERRGRSRSRTRNKNNGGRSPSPSPSPTSSGGAAAAPPQRPICSAPLGASSSTSTPPSAAASSSEGNAAAPEAAAGRVVGLIDHWQADRSWGYVLYEGARHHFAIGDVVGGEEAPPSPIRKGMSVEFTRGVNPPGGRHAGKPNAREVRFIV
jgi:hypothetical protein